MTLTHNDLLYGCVKEIQMPKLAIPKCDKCGHKWHARYRRSRATVFFCPQCSRKHPVWTSAQIQQINADAAMLKEKFKPAAVAV